MAVDHTAQKPPFDALYCEEQVESPEEISEIITPSAINFDRLLLFEHDCLWDDEELQSLFIKERESCFRIAELGLSLSRNQAVQWMLRIRRCHGFSALTAVLAANFLDRFLSGCRDLKREKAPWMVQLSAVASLSLAAKVEETRVPLLLDLQVEDAEYLFEAKTIQRMELLILSALKWRMNPVTPLSFLDHIVRRLGLKRDFHWEFLRRCENLILSLIADSRFVRYLPSVLAATTMLHVINQVERGNIVIDYESQLLSLLRISKEEVEECSELIADVGSSKNPLKRRIWEIPRGVIMEAIISSDSSNDSVEITSSSSLSLSSSSHQPTLKKTRVGEEEEEEEEEVPYNIMEKFSL